MISTNPTMRTETQTKAVIAACKALNSYAKRKDTLHAVRKGRAWKVTPEMLVTLEEAREMMKGEGKALKGWSDLSVFVPHDIAVKLYEGMTAKARECFVSDEVIGGWFEEQNAEFDDHGQLTNADEVGCDEDAEFCSTPSHSEDLPSVDEYAEDTESCSRGGLLFIYSDKY